MLCGSGAIGWRITERQANKDQNNVFKSATSFQSNQVDWIRWHQQTLASRADYAIRKQTMEPVFGIIKSVMGFRQFSLRGLRKVTGEWNLVCLASRVRQLFVPSHPNSQ